MSHTTPKISELRANIVAQVAGEISQTVPALPKATVNVLAAVWAGVVVLLYKYADFIFLQIFVRFATYDQTTIGGRVIRPLQEHGDMEGVDPLGAGSRARLVISIPVDTQSGSLPVDAQLVRLPTGVIYKTLSAVSLNAATVQATIEAIQDPNNNGGYGALGNLVAGDTVQFVSPQKNVRREATVVSVDTAGADAELVPSYRKRIQDKRQKRPQGGAHADYYHWALTVPGIIDALPYAGNPGQISVYVEATEASSGSADGIPTSSQLEAVLAAIELDGVGQATRRPIGAGVTAYAITRKAFDLVVAGLSVDDPATAQESIEIGVDEYLRSLSPYIVGLSIPPRADAVTQAGVAGVVYEIVNAAGGSLSSVTVNDSGSSVAVYYLQPGEKAKLGTTSWPSS